MSNECKCHIFAPCDFCLSLDDEEASAYANGGHRLLKSLRDSRTIKAHNEAFRKANPNIQVGNKSDDILTPESYNQ